jgi:hypothetical protein
MTEEKDLTVFHNESGIHRIILWANVIGYVLLGFSLISFFGQAYELSTQWEGVQQAFSQQPWQVINYFFSQLLKEPLVGVFYFLVLRGISELLNLGLDLFYETEEEIEIDVEALDPEV